MYRERGTHFIHAGDEWYLLQAGSFRTLRTDISSWENGVGMVRLFREELAEALTQRRDEKPVAARKVTIATGTLAAPILREAADQIEAVYPGIKIQVIPVENHFFGERITVAGLLTGQDLKKQLTGRNLGDELLLTENMFRDGEEVFLDDMTAEELSGGFTSAL